MSLYNVNFRYSLDLDVDLDIDPVTTNYHLQTIRIGDKEFDARTPIYKVIRVLCDEDIRLMAEEVEDVEEFDHA